MKDADLLVLLDTIYGCAAGQQEWSTFLGQYAAHFPSVKPAIAGYDSEWQHLNVWLIEGIPDDYIKSYAEHYYKINPWADFVRNLPTAPDVSWGHDYIPTEEIKRTAFYNEFVVPLDDAAAGFGSMLIKEKGRFLNFQGNVSFKHIEEGEAAAECLKRIGPHLVRAFELYRNLGGAPLYLNALEATLDQLSNAVFVVDETLRLRFANQRAEAYLRAGETVRTTPPDTLAFASPDNQKTIEDQIGRIAGKTDKKQSTYVRLASPKNRPLVAFVAKLRLDGDRHIHRPGRILLPLDHYAIFLIPAKDVANADEAAIMSVLGVTRAEARLAKALLNGRSLREHAIRTQITYNTARSHMKALLAKTNLDNQADLAKMLTRIFSP